MAALTHGLSSTLSPLFHHSHSHPHTLFQHRRSLSTPAGRSKQVSKGKEIAKNCKSVSFEGRWMAASLIQCYGLCFTDKDHHFGRTAVQEGRFPLHTCRNLHVQVLRRRVIAQAVPSAGSAAVAIVIIGAAIVALSRVKNDGTQGFQLQKKECEICKGSGICSSCSGEGFLLKNLSPEAAAKARAGAKDAATRYTAGLPNKWRYCTACSGSRNCLACEGRGWLA